MFERAYAVLDKNGHDTDGFQLKLAFYRNYSSPIDLLLQTSSWENKPQNLISFLRAVEVEGGQGNEAVEVGLWQANTEPELTKVILIGDAPANSRQEIKKKRDGKLFTGTKFQNETFYIDELNKLKERKIIINAFYVDNRAKQNFEEIARATNGQASFLDIASPTGAESLTDLITCEVLSDVGGEKLVKAYRNGGWRR